jgi:hypothetical protein
MYDDRHTHTYTHTLTHKYIYMCPWVHVRICVWEHVVLCTCFSCMFSCDRMEDKELRATNRGDPVNALDEDDKWYSGWFATPVFPLPDNEAVLTRHQGLGRLRRWIVRFLVVHDIYVLQCSFFFGLGHVCFGLYRSSDGLPLYLYVHMIWMHEVVCARRG